MKTSTARFKVLGIDRDQDVCDCCGKTNLKLTVVLARLDVDGGTVEVVRFGRDCAARATKLRRTASAMEAVAAETQRQADEEKRNTPVICGTWEALWIVERIGNNGGTVETIRVGRGLRSEVLAWATKEYPNYELNVRKPIR